jgi:hypothetical protein
MRDSSATVYDLGKEGLGATFSHILKEATYTLYVKFWW